MIPRPQPSRIVLVALLAATPLLAQTPPDPRSTGGTEASVKPAGLPPGPQAPVKAVFAALR